MVKASEKWGFFKLVNHGVPKEIVENYTTRLHELFDLPMEQKLKGGKTSNLPLGYYASNPKYMNEMDKLRMIIFEMLAHGLGLEDDFFSKNFEEKKATYFRISRYPPCPLPEKIVGIGIHSDPQTLTILHQDQTWTNGRLKSVIHKAVVNKEKQRLSIAYFMSPTSSATIECPPQLIDPFSNPRKYESFTWAELRHLLLTTRRSSKMIVEFAKKVYGDQYHTISATIECPPQLIDPVFNPRKYESFTWAELRHLVLTTRRVRGKAVALNKFLISN
ncbi:gibberellin 20 oxidase 1 [Nicotiana attenuata]|uniref:Gibberellin 20 oxidase 1 n=1 Tax=Nicotiana attenuata TaxID=49451 RepID=A0A1J6I3K0_NICAT|nr:gibberellin 20 oxidase 1 [Nicotiana attenuata]